LFVIIAIHCPLIGYVRYLYQRYPATEGLIALRWYELLVFLFCLVLPWLSMARLGLLSFGLGEPDYVAEEDESHGNG